MKITNEFFNFCLALHQDYELYGPEPEDWIRGALENVPEERHIVLKDYLNELLSGNYSDAQLSEIYHSTSPELGFRDNRELRQFLELACDIIGKSSIT